MMRRLFLFATAGFWSAVLAFWLGSQRSPELPHQMPVAERQWSLAEVAAHALPEDCWMAIDGQVYDISAYMPDHPSRPAVIVPWCGQEASEAYRTKGKGRPHSPEADRLLASYQIGALARP